MSAPHPCEPQPELYKAFADRGLYSKQQYCTWGLHAEEAILPTMLAKSVAHVRRKLAEEQCVGIGGICDGAIVAALVALQAPEQVRFYVNCCAGPLRMAQRYLDAHPQLSTARVTVPSLHLLSFDDTLFSYAELSEVPRLCDGGNILLHAQGHAFPLFSPQMQRSLRGVVSGGSGGAGDDHGAVVLAATTTRLARSPHRGRREPYERARRAPRSHAFCGPLPRYLPPRTPKVPHHKVTHRPTE